MLQSSQNKSRLACNDLTSCHECSFTNHSNLGKKNKILLEGEKDQVEVVQVRHLQKETTKESFCCVKMTL